MRLSIRHATTYAYDPPAERCALRLRLYPPAFDSQRVIAWKVSVNDHVVSALLSTATGDRESIWTCAGGHAEVAIVAEGEIETRDAAGVVKGLKDTVRPQVFLRPTPLTETDKRIEELAAGVTGDKALDRMHALFNAVADAVAYKPGATSSATTAAQALKAGQGVCQDHAHVFIAAARVLRFPARYVVGYLLASEEKLTETHAWAEAWAPDIGWVGFDPANDICTTDAHARVAIGLDYLGAAPVRGTYYGGGAETLTVAVKVEQVGRPGQWQSQSQS